ncbi:MAG: hypothetical protein KDD11_06005 [Acidobacteria bacterium]|nr:hypothetical protein [Acidobacteriota bacterium]
MTKAFRQAKCSEGDGQAIARLEAEIENVEADSAHRIYAVQLSGDLALERRKLYREDYFMQLVGRSLYSESLRPLMGSAFLQVSRLSVASLRDLPAQEERLVALLQARLAGSSMEQTRDWAADELCNMGSARAPEALRARLGKRMDRTQEAEYHLCEHKVELLRKYQNPSEAFLGALSEVGASTWEELGPRFAGELQRWAIDGLLELDSKLGEKELLAIAGDQSWRSSAREQAIRKLHDLGFQYEALIEAGVEPIVLVRQRIHPMRYYQDRGLPIDPCARMIPVTPEE